MFFSSLVRSFRNKFSTGIAIDLGTANTIIYAKGKGLLLDQPSIVAMIVEKGYEIPYLFGDDAKQMLGKTPNNICVYRPLKDGVVADFQIAEEMIRHYITLVLRQLGSFILSPLVIVCVPLESTSVERRAIQSAVSKCGAKEVYLIEEPMAAAIGSDLPVSEPIGSVIIDIGGGTTEIAMISLGGIVHGKSIKIGGNKIDESIVQYIRQKYNLLIGLGTAEKLKKKIGVAYVKPGQEIESCEVRGRDLATGSPKEISVNQTDLVEALSDPISNIVEAIRSTLETAPPELASDIVDRGIVITGGGAILRNIDYVISESTGLPVFISPNPLLSVAIGTGKVLESYQSYSHILFKQI